MLSGVWDEMVMMRVVGDCFAFLRFPSVLRLPGNDARTVHSCTIQ